MPRVAPTFKSLSYDDQLKVINNKLNKLMRAEKIDKGELPTTRWGEAVRKEYRRQEAKYPNEPAKVILKKAVEEAKKTYVPEEKKKKTTTGRKKIISAKIKK